MTIYAPYTYFVGWSQQNVFYYGVRYAKGCSPNDFWVTYFTSSKEVKKNRAMLGEPDILQIRRTFSTSVAARDWEHRVLRRMNASKRADFLNKTNGKCPSFAGGKHTREHIQSLTGRKLSAEHCEAIKRGMVGKVVISEKQRDAIRLSNSTRAVSDETRAKIASHPKGDSVKRAVAEANSKRVITDEYRANLRAGQAKRHAKKLAAAKA